METPLISKKEVIDTLRSLEYGYSGYSIKDDRLEGAYILASELTGLSVDALSEKVFDALDDQSEKSSKDIPTMTKINRIKNLRNYNREYLSDHRYLIDRHEVLEILEDNKRGK